MGVILVMIILGFFFRVYANSVRRTVEKDSNFFLLAAIFPYLIMMAEALQGYLNGVILVLTSGAIMIVLFSMKLSGNSRHSKYRNGSSR